MDEDVKNKIVEHTVGEVKKIAEKRGRNLEWAEKAVRESISSTWKEALDENVIDLIASDLNELLERIDGWEVTMESGERVLHTKDAEINTIKMNLRDRLLSIISDPNIAYILLILGFYGLFFELSNPGSIFPGVVGGICIILAFFALQTLPVNYAGILLILLAIVLFVLEVKITSYGLLSLGGIVSMLIGSMMLIDTTEPFAYIFRISWQVILPAMLVTAGFFIIALVFVIRTHREKAFTGKEGLIGTIGICETEINPEGKIFVHGELWNSISEEVIHPKEKVRVIGADGLTLKVEKLETD
jgi:membrane-bound serine protease (ClpP class)